MINWREIFVPSVSPVEIFVRGTLTYFFIFILLRIFRRETGAISLTDLLLIVLIADAAQNSMTGGYKSVSGGAILISTLAFWNFGLNWLGTKVKFVEHLLHPPPLPLIKEGKLNSHTMRHQLVTMDELMSQLREQGIQSPKEVKTAFIEGDGTISVVKYGEDRVGQRKKRGSAGT